MVDLRNFYYDFFYFNLPVVITEKRFFVIDTYMGPESIKDVLAFCREAGSNKKGYIVNTHFHFDHIWGNSAFRELEIIAHKKCYDIIKSEGEKHIEEIKKEKPEWIKEKVHIVLPSITFEEELTFYESGCSVCIKHLPGHTEDSSVVIIKPDNILIGGDMVEDPFPNLEWSCTDLYIENLKKLEKFNFTRVIPSHGTRQDPELIRDNINYLEKLKAMVLSSLAEGREPDEINIPLECLLTSSDGVTPFYREVIHRNNIKKLRNNYD